MVFSLPSNHPHGLQYKDATENQRENKDDFHTTKAFNGRTKKLWGRKGIPLICPKLKKRQKTLLSIIRNSDIKN